jgi:uncharacterized protein YdbL (DUF1318 family)
LAEQGDDAMKSKRVILVALTLLAGLWLAAGTAFSDDIKGRMIARLPVLKDLKAQGVIGENNQGYLEYRGFESPNKEVVQAENEDRQAVYSAIAKQQGATVELVGKQRAIQIAEKAGSGEWLQHATGTWYQKK